MINCVAIDDEPIALSILEEYCSRIGEVSIKSFTSPIDGMECITSSSPDIVFLDIEMNSHNGVDIARHLPENCCLIFTTAYAKYALDGFDVNAVDFLHKPIFFTRFERALEKARMWIEARNLSGKLQSLTLRSGHKNVVIDLNDILLIEAMDNYIKVFRKGSSTVLSQITMKDMEEMLPKNQFKRVHRSYIVPLDAVDRFSNRQIYLSGYDKPIPVGRKYNEAFNHTYNNLNQK